MSASSCST
jgi:hypothetical protein